MNYFPLLDIKQAIADADRNLSDVEYYVQTLYQDKEGHCPPDAARLLANVGALRDLLRLVIPPALEQAIAAEQALYDEEEARYGD